jgi:hypothetical protein
MTMLTTMHGRDIVDAIYGRFHDSEYQRIQGIGGAYVLPCAQEINITFNFAGKPYPIHPLDMSLYACLASHSRSFC